VSDRYQLRSDIVYLLAVMISAETFVWMQTHSTHLALKLCPPPLVRSYTAMLAVELTRHALWPMANKASAYNCWGDWMHASTLAGIGGRYLLQQLLAEVEQASLLVVVHAQQLVGVADARIE